MVTILKILFIILLATFSSTSYALDGEVYFSVLDGNLAAAPAGNKPTQGIAGVLVGQDFWCFHPWASIETRIDNYKAPLYSHPASVDYGMGVEAHLYKGFYSEVSHHCWHPVDSAGKVEEFNAATIKYKFGKGN